MKILSITYEKFPSSYFTYIVGKNCVSIEERLLSYNKSDWFVHLINKTIVRVFNPIDVEYDGDSKETDSEEWNEAIASAIDVVEGTWTTFNDEREMVLKKLANLLK